MEQTLEQDKMDACKAVATIVSSLCEKHRLSPLDLRLGFKPDYQNGGKIWDGTVHLTVGG